MLIRKSSRLKLGRAGLASSIEVLIEPVTYMLILLTLGFHQEGRLSTSYFLMALMAFALSYPGKSRLHQGYWRMVQGVLLRWSALAALLLLLLYGVGQLNYFSREIILAWLLLNPLCLIMGHGAFKLLLPRWVRYQGGYVRSIIVGVNAQGLSLARNLQYRPDVFCNLLGLFDDRTAERIGRPDQEGLPPLLGSINDVAEFVRQQRVQCIYLALPMTRQERIVNLLEALKDTTASIYFVPDIFVTDLIQGRVGALGETLVVAVCETPFTGLNGLIKRLTDVLLSSSILLILAPLMACIALAVKLTSRGPVFFRQRRYGLDGQEILIYKFRSMSVTEDGAQIRQATRDDQRITVLGRFLRKTSLDELPQFFNVLQGSMSIVGPRPHAVAHNELYRRLIKGYMVRHKVKPGITGWAQVNGYRGETETIDKMQKRIDYDLDYLRNWSLGLDMKIILKTIKVVFHDQQAY